MLPQTDGTGGEPGTERVASKPRLFSLSGETRPGPGQSSLLQPSPELDVYPQASASSSEDVAEG